MSKVTGYVRTGAALAGIATAVLALAGCQAGSVTTTGASGVSGSAVATTSAATPAPATTQPAGPTTPPAAQTTAAAASNPTPDACPSAVEWAVYINSVGFDNATSLDQITAQQAEGVCPDGAQVPTTYTLIGPPTNYDVNPGVQITGINSNGQQFSETWAQFAASNLGEYGGFYGTTISQAVEVLTITQLKPQQ